MQNSLNGNMKQSHSCCDVLALQGLPMKRMVPPCPQYITGNSMEAEPTTSSAGLARSAHEVIYGICYAAGIFWREGLQLRGIKRLDR